MNRLTVSKIVENAKAAQEAWSIFSQDEKLKIAFHLRPTRNGITVVSTLPDAPMRGFDVISHSISISEFLKKIIEKKDVLLGVEAKSVLKELGFKQRKTQSFRKEDAQAMFIKGMIQKQNIYEGIEFVASEFTLERRNRFDVVGYKDNVLYVFELKNEPTFSCIEQTARYVKLVKQHKADFLKVLGCYPHFPVVDFNDVRGVAVMRYAVNATEGLAKQAKEEGVGLWYYEQSISFRNKS